MIKEIIDKLVALLAVSALLASCSESELWQNPQTEARDGYIMLNFKTEIPAMQEVVTRAVDPDGGGVQDMTLFCFDSYGLFISTVKAGVTVQKPGPGEMEGTFKAEVPEIPGPSISWPTRIWMNSRRTVSATSRSPRSWQCWRARPDA